MKKECLKCGGVLSGKQKKYCSRSCGINHWREENIESCREADKRYKIKNREKVLKRYKEYNEKNKNNIKYKLKRKARRHLLYKIEKGEILRPEECSKCYRKGKIEGHHEDYNKPLDVIWLCSKCHSHIHKLVNE